METPTEYFGVFDASPDAEDAEIRSSYRAAFIGAVIVLVLVPLAVLIVTRTEAESVKKDVAPTGTMLSWGAQNETAKRTFLIGDYALTLSSRAKQTGESFAVLHAKVCTGE